ncbi:ectoine hydroxylase [Tuberibacillus sp. Marseille-P3662]|uniref:ectoine hydroxylase n=1 Tax=Tuberibacillus sp. Marseille-P3662 TaxID=1965358 RepID=UPI000A1CA88D|nr:ectoine hydroxylase [Tuberibacillus sp. Marseille-P3662]
MEDLYPSRKKLETEMTLRKDPVIHSQGAGEGPLSEEQLGFYEKNGFLLLENYFSDESVKEMQKEIFALRDAEHDKQASEIIREPESDEIRSIFAVHRDHSYFEAIAKSDPLTDIVQQLLGSDVYIHQSRINYKPGFKGKEFDWHSDFETWHVEDGMPRMRAVSVSITLSDNYVFNGPLMLVPGSQNYFISCLGKTPNANYKTSLKKQKLGVPDQASLEWLVERGGISVPTGKAGSVILFESNTMHGSSGNMTPFDRNNLFMVYNSVYNHLVEPFAGTEPRPDFIATRERIPVTS